MVLSFFRGVCGGGGERSHDKIPGEKDSVCVKTADPLHCDGLARWPFFFVAVSGFHWRSGTTLFFSF